MRVNERTRVRARVNERTRMCACVQSRARARTARAVVLSCVSVTMDRCVRDRPRRRARRPSRVARVRWCVYIYIFVCRACVFGARARRVVARRPEGQSFFQTDVHRDAIDDDDGGDARDGRHRPRSRDAWERIARNASIAPRDRTTPHDTARRTAHAHVDDALKRSAVDG